MDWTKTHQLPKSQFSLKLILLFTFQCISKNKDNKILYHVWLACKIQLKEIHEDAIKNITKEYKQEVTVRWVLTCQNDIQLLMLKLLFLLVIFSFPIHMFIYLFYEAPILCSSNHIYLVFPLFDTLHKTINECHYIVILHFCLCFLLFHLILFNKTIIEKKKTDF